MPRGACSDTNGEVLACNDPEPLEAEVVMPTVAIIGASRGIGLELARQYAAGGWRVHATTRAPKRPGALGEIRGDVHLHELEVTDRGQQRALRGALTGEAIDVLIHNAGVYGTGMSDAAVSRTNAEAPIEVAETLMDAVLHSEQKKIALITSQMGARQGSGRSLGKYGDSKAALNDRFRAVERDWREAGCLAVVIHPGWVRTDMGGSGASLSVEESARGIRRVMADLDEAHHGRFWTWDGREHPW